MINLEIISQSFGNWAKENGVVLVTAESCTAGLIGATVAMTSGSSAWLDRGFIVYTPEAKNEMLAVSLDTINIYNITSVEVAKEMAKGALVKSKANIAVSVTGVAGPNGGTEEIPVGTVCVGYCYKRDGGLVCTAEKLVFLGDRNTVREGVVAHVLNTVMHLNIDV